MGILIGQHEFVGPLETLNEVPATPGLYAVLQKENRQMFLLDMGQSDNLADSIKRSTLGCKDKLLVVYPCNSRDQRKTILHELIREFEYEDEEPVQAAPARRAETKSGVGLAI